MHFSSLRIIQYNTQIGYLANTWVVNVHSKSACTVDGYFYPDFSRSHKNRISVACHERDILRVSVVHLIFNLLFFLAELFRILYGTVQPGEQLERGKAAERKAKMAGTAGYRLSKPPISDQVHVVLWVVKANDVRLTQGKYMDKFGFLRQQLGKESELTGSTQHNNNTTQHNITQHNTTTQHNKHNIANSTT